ncbi:DgyrCDS6662 [Dimorphilus gyrociliatus]|uniref:DgyrCDS6662 n=1 Tax=Dimorphilus gyrociliatus TaxID=2664684 RepID=A0A7I8VQ99_9ANNE|nr:DgyrCDS6662 [Dimorphilus gyrociliatus]
MSRIIVKNLPKNIKEERLRKLFSEKGVITNCNLKYTPDGVFRKFAFIGYQTDSAANNAIKFFNNTYIDTNKIVVESCQKLGEKYKARPWSKYSKGSSAYKRLHPDEVDHTEEKAKSFEKKAKIEKINVVGELDKDEKFKEFVSLHQNLSVKPSWQDDGVTVNNDGKDIAFESDDDSDEESGHKEKKEKSEDEPEKEVEEDNEKQLTTEERERDKVNRVLQTSRLFVRNLYYDCQEDHLKDLFSVYGEVNEVHMPVDFKTEKSLGFAFISFTSAENAVKAMTELDGCDFQGRLLHILPAEKKRDDDGVPENLTYKAKKLLEKKQNAGSVHNWNALFVSPSAVADVMAHKYNVDKMDVLEDTGKDSLAVRMALGETEIVAETKDFLIKNGVKIDIFGKPETKRSERVLIVKNLSSGTRRKDIENMFEKYGDIERVVIPPYGLTALVMFRLPIACRNAFRAIAYKKVKDSPIYLERAPFGVFDEDIKPVVETEDKPKKRKKNKKHKEEEAESEKVDSNSKTEEKVTAPDQNKEEKEKKSINKKNVEHVTGKIIVKNVPFEATQKEVRELFSTFGELKYVRLPKKVSGGHRGFAFIEYISKEHSKVNKF